MPASKVRITFFFVLLRRQSEADKSSVGEARFVSGIWSRDRSPTPLFSCCDAALAQREGACACVVGRGLGCRAGLRARELGLLVPAGSCRRPPPALASRSERRDRPRQQPHTRS
jgi:hypothetical protein